MTTRVVSNVIAALGSRCLLPGHVEAPAWIGGGDGRPQAVGILAAANGLVDLNDATSASPKLLPLDPQFFNPVAVPYLFDPVAPVPELFLKYLADVWPDDREAVELLQEWFGYILTPDTRFQKALMMTGPRRSGKGTICGLMRRMIGPANTVGPTLAGLCQDFGLAPLLGKSLAIVADARVGGRSDKQKILEVLLNITGEDPVTIPRKHRESVTTRLTTRFVLASNELPRIGDASGAFASRFLMLPMTKSFAGRENPNR